MKIGMVSLGCPKNLVDSEVMLGIIKDKQLEITNDPADAELIIVNTCGFIESAKEESISTILQMAQYKEDGSCKYLIMTGCLGQRYADELFESMLEVDAIVGTDSFTDIGWVIDQVLAGKRVKHLQKLESKNVQAPPRMLTTPGYMAYLPRAATTAAPTALFRSCAVPTPAVLMMRLWQRQEALLLTASRS